MKRVIEILLPFFATLFLWRLSCSVLNPCGILALVPIFYFSVIKERGGFLPMALIGCFLLDKNFDSMLLWTSLFCFFYAVLGLQNIINIESQRIRGIYLFMSFIGAGVGILGIGSAFSTGSLIPIFTAIQMFIVATIAYAPMTYLFERTICWTKK